MTEGGEGIRYAPLEAGGIGGEGKGGEKKMGKAEKPVDRDGKINKVNAPWRQKRQSEDLGPGRAKKRKACGLGKRAGDFFWSRKRLCGLFIENQVVR